MLRSALEGQAPNEALYIQSEDWHYSLAYPSAVSGANKELLTKAIDEKNRELRKALKNSGVVFITLGTSWIYYHKELETYVANCHKLPQKLFEKRILSFEQSCDYLKNIQNLLKAWNPGIRVVFTVSPVKHIKDGITENALSKALLLGSVRQELRADFSHYFPSYELLTEDLRDYRYYKKDLVHPNDVAVDYIWEKFSAAFFTGTTMALNKRIAKVLGAAGHKILEPGKKAQLFTQKQLQHIDEIEREIGSGHFNEEKNWFQSLL